MIDVKMKKYGYRLLSTAWLAVFLGLFLFMAVRALPPGAYQWDLGSFSQEGQLSVFNQVSDGGYWGHPVELGDYDGDGHVDLVLAPMAADAGPAHEREKAGEVYVYPGNGRISGILDRSTAEGDALGLTLWGARENDFLGTELFSADVNGDGIQDLLLSAQNHDHGEDPGGPDCCPGCRDNCGAVYVVFGREGLLDGGRTIDLAQSEQALAEAGVLKIVGATGGERLGIWVEAGDLDGDGFDEILAGADHYPASDSAENQYAGKVYVIYGRSEYPDFMDLSTFQDEVSVILGKDFDDHFGGCLHSADLNADGHRELIVAASLNRLSASWAGCSSFRADATGGGAERSGEIYVFFGQGGGARLPAETDLRTDTAALLDAGKLTLVRGERSFDFAGEELGSGDLNGDGFTDLVVGALTADGAAGERDAGRAYIVYWEDGLEGKTIYLSSPPPEGPRVSTIIGANEGDILGDTLSAADFNHDGITDLSVGIPRAEVGGETRAGIVAIVFGRPEPLPRFWVPQADENPDRIELAFLLGVRNEDLMAYSMEAGDYDGDGYADVYPNAMRGDGGEDRFRDAGEAYVVSGFHLIGGSVELTRVEPAVGDLGVPIPVIVIGRGFTTTRDTELRLGDRPVETFEVLSGSRMEALFPANATGSTWSVTVSNRHGSATLDGGFRYGNPAAFVRGDSNRDGFVDISDPIRTLTVLFLGRPPLCHDSSDSNDDGEVNLTDVVFTLEFLFRGGDPLPPPHPDPGLDPTQDDLDCLR